MTFSAKINTLNSTFCRNAKNSKITDTKFHKMVYLVS